ncbi:hypothetical protein RI367_000616 [Sorochytrium milnesiophthora]
MARQPAKLHLPQLDAAEVKNAFAYFGSATLAAYEHLLASNGGSRVDRNVLRDFANDMLQAVPYKDVARETRIVYEASTLVAALKEAGIDLACSGDVLQQALSTSSSSSSSSSSDAVRMLDEIMIIAGAPLFHDAELELVQHLHQSLECAQPPLQTDDAAEQPRPRLGGSDIPCTDAARFDPCSMSVSEPLIIRGGVAWWPAVNSWSVERFVQEFGQRVVPVEIGSSYVDNEWTQRLMTVQDFMLDYVQQPPAATEHRAAKRPRLSHNPDHRQTAYLAQHDLFFQFPALRRDISIPDYIYEMPGGSDGSDHVRTNVWLGPAGTVTPLHHDGDTRNFFAQVRGSKYFCLYSPDDSASLYPHDGLMANTSQVDVLHPDREAFPNFSRATCKEGVLHAGDLLYLPPRWWHFVQSLSVSFSVSFWW